jgi:arsenite transporter
LRLRLLPKFAPVTIAALLGTLVLIFAFQADNITGRFFHVLLIAIPITLQVYLNAGLAYGLMKRLKVEHSVAAPGALIGASNFFEPAVATAIALFGPQSGAALATVVGVFWKCRLCFPYALPVTGTDIGSRQGK